MQQILIETLTSEYRSFWWGTTVGMTHENASHACTTLVRMYVNQFYPLLTLLFSDTDATNTRRGARTPSMHPFCACVHVFWHALSFRQAKQLCVRFQLFDTQMRSAPHVSQLLWRLSPSALIGWSENVPGRETKLLWSFLSLKPT